MEKNLSTKEILASVVIPVYNKENYIKECFDSLSKQNISANKIEIIFINDGSTDGSLNICRQIASCNNNVVVISKENGGVSSARNAGIDAAQGKYIFFLDPDDALKRNTILDVCNFFDAHYEETDLVTYPITPLSDGNPLPKHYRYKILTTNGIYNLKEPENALICQTTMNIAVKNQHGNNNHFNFHSVNGVEFHEDQKYINEILLKKMTIGYVSTGCYFWQRNETSTMSNVINPYYIFENTINMYEELFNNFPDCIPSYYQSLFSHDIGWKMKANALFPRNKEDQKNIRLINRFIKLLKCIDDDMICRHPSINNYHKVFFLRLKHQDEKNEIMLNIGANSIALTKNKYALYSSNSVEFSVLRFYIRKNYAKVVGCLKSPIFDFANTVALFARTRSLQTEVKQEIKLHRSSLGYVSGSEYTNTFLSFEFPIKLQDETTISFDLFIDGKITPVNLNYPLRSKPAKWLNNTYVTPSWIVAFAKNATIQISAIDKKGYFRAKSEQRNRTHSFSVKYARSFLDLVQFLKDKHKINIWLYFDSIGKTDNSWIQFKHDSCKNDNILRFYIAHNISLKSLNSRAKVIKFGTKLHKFLFCIADKIICSDIAISSYYPISLNAATKYQDYLNAEKIYLQHGVLWAHMPWYYSADRVLFDYEVISTSFEEDNLTKNYGFTKQQLIKSGMPRYALVNHKAHPKKLILLAPSWRSYLIGPLTPKGRKPYFKKFKRSDYFLGIQSLLKSENLAKVLNEHGYQLHLKLHPLFEEYKKCFSIPFNNITFAPENVSSSDYSIMVTDYSSFSFDFVYLKRAVIYYIPDEKLFFGGINQYAKLDLDLDNAFGKFAHSPEEVENEIRLILENKGKPLPEYAEKMDNFFLYYDQEQPDRIYNALHNTN